MDRRCAAGALLALAACIATTAAAPTASNQTALDLYEGPSEGCYYNFQHYGEGDRIMTNEPCLNCTCHNRMLMCYLRVCPFTKPIGQDCSVEKRADQCCPIVTCPDVPVDLLTSTSTSSPSEYGETGLGKLDRYGCSINGKYFPEGSKVPPSPNKPCEHCYCIRNMTTCVMQECTLHVDGCTPIYRKDVCCPVRYSCDHPEDEIPLLDDMTTTVRPTPGFLLTTTTLAPVTQMTQDCVHDDKIFADGASIKTEKACEHCYCMKGDIVCVVQECGTPMENEGKNCTSMPPHEGQCCPDTYICEGDEMTTETKPDIATVTPFEDITTLSPPRRVSVEGSGYRSETDEPSTEVSPLEPDTEGSGEEQYFKPTDANEMLLPESETSHPLIVTDQDEIPDHYSPGTTEVPETEPKITEKTTTEADKGENTVPSGDFEDDSSDKTSPETTTTKLETEKESSYDAKTTALPEDESSLKDKTTPHEEITATEPAVIAESTIADHKLHTSPDSIVTSEEEMAETTIPTRRKDEDEMMPKKTTTLKHLEESTTKTSDIIASDVAATEITTSSSIEQEVKTTTSQLIEKEIEAKESTTESSVELTTESDVIKADTQTATTVQPELATVFTTVSKVDLSYTTSANPIENEIDEESFPTLAPGRIPGEGDCLLDGVTYSHESIVPSSSHCRTSCRCISSIVKCEPIVCSPPPDYMDNCQPMYDSPESCCPTYVCDHPRETVPPQSHSQMAGTESPISTPTIECDGGQCKTDEDKKDATPSVPCTSDGCADDSNKKPDECGSQGCGEVANKPEKARPAIPTEECNGDSCSSSPDHCASGKCETEIPKDQTCNDEHGCEIPVIQTCQGDDCATQPDVTGPKEAFTPCDNPNGCKDQTCNKENGCDIPVVQTCQGDDCEIQPDITASKDDSTHCDNPDGCKDVQIPEKAPPCTGESCVSELPSQIPQESQDCKDGSDCGQSNQTPTTGECNEEECKTQHVPEINKHLSDCIGTKCTQQQDHVPHITDIPEFSSESAPRVTELPEELETKSEEPVTELPKTTAIEKEIELSATTKASIPEKGEESGTTPQYEEIDNDKEKDTHSHTTISKSPEIVTQATEGEQEESITESANKGTTMVPLDITKVKEILPEMTPAFSEVPTTEIPSLSDKDTKETITELPIFVGTELPEPTLKPISDTESEVPEDAAKDKDTADITTTEGATQSSSAKITEETTKSPEMLTLAPETLDRDGHEKPTKEPEYVQDTEEKITETTERYTPAPEQITEKLEVEPIKEEESQGTQTTPKSYEGQTAAPEVLVTASPEPQSTSAQDEDQKIPELPVSTSTPEELVTSKPDDTKQTAGDMSLPDTTEIAETQAPELIVDEATSKPEDLDLSNVTPGDDEITKVHDITGEPESQTETPKPFITLPQETSAEESDEDKKAETPPPVIVDSQTQTPMSIVKDHGDDKFGSTVTPEPAITTDRSTTESESPQSTSMPAKTPSEETVSEFEKMPSVSDEGHSATTPAEKLGTSAIAEDVFPTEKPVSDSDKTAPETETSTGSSPISVPIVTEPISSESSVTEANLPESSAPQEKTSDSMETKSPTSIPESSVQSTTVTELPELIVHEHPTEPSSIEKESEQPMTEEAVTKEPQEIIPVPVTSDVPIPQDALTITPEIPEGVSQSGRPDEVSITKAPEISQPETTESKLDDELPHIPELSSTGAQKEVTEGPELQVTSNTPEVTDVQKEEIETTATQVTVTSAPKVSETEPQETITESQPSVTETDLFVTQPHKDTTEAPESNDVVTKPSDSSETSSESQTESPAMPEEPEIQSHTETTKTQDVTTTAPEISLTSQKESTETPESQDTATKVVDISSDKSDKETSEEPKPQDASVLELSETEPQGEITKAPEVTDVATNVPETLETGTKDDIAEAPVLQDLTTSLPELPITETVPIEDTKIPMIEEKVTVPEITGTVPSIEATEAPTHDDSSSNVPEVHATEAPATEDTVTNVPETLITESHQDTQAPESQDTATSSPGLPETEPKKESTEAPESQQTSSTIPETSTEPKKEITELPATQGITDAPEISADTKAPESEPKKEITELPETQGITDAPEISADTKAPETEPKKEVTELPETQGITDAPEISAGTKAPETEPKKEITELPETQGITDVPEISSDTKPPEKSDTASPGEVTNAPETQTMATNAPQVPTISETEMPETPESTEPHYVPTETSEELESQKPGTELPEISPELATNAPEMLATKSDTDITEAPEQEFTTKTPEPLETEPEPEKSSITEKDGSVTDSPLKITTKFDDQTKSKPQEFVTPTESSKLEPETPLTTEVGSSTEADKKITESQATEYPVKIADSDSETKKPYEGVEIGTEMPFVEPVEQTESSVSGSIESETNAPELIDTGLGATVQQELPVTEKQDSRRTEPTSAPLEEDVTKALETLVTPEKTTIISEEPVQTTKEEYPETTPDLVLLEEHTHKTVSPDVETSTSPSDIPLKEYEPSTPEISIEKVTESVLSTESEKSPHEDVVSDKDQSVPEVTATTTPEKSTEPLPVSEEITTISPLPESLDTEKPHIVESNEISTSPHTIAEEPTETEKPLVPSVESESEKPQETNAPGEEFILASTKATTTKAEEQSTTLSPLLDKFGKPGDEAQKPAAEPEKSQPDVTEELPKPGANEVQPTEEALPPEEESHFPPSGTSGYGQEPDYGEEDSFGPGTCRYGGKVYVSAQQIPRDDPCDFCFCFRSDIICLQQSCPPPIHGCHEEPIQGFCCPRYECPVSMATTLNVTTTTTTTTTTLPPHFLPHAYKGAAQRRGCQIKGHIYKVGEVVRASSGPCLHCTCGGDGQMKCDPKVCTPEPMLRQMIAAAVSAKRRR
ncbi:mucin-2 isoform X2 [Cydia strobilella]|uniref:mucin-2 isoform X2 n=1 Tax=Cydia strobilella TaxID=1100964 RepID=UPI003006FEE6